MATLLLNFAESIAVRIRHALTRRHLYADQIPFISNTRLHDTVGCQWGCQTGCTTGLTTVLNEQPLFVQPVFKPGCTTGLTTGCIHDTTGCQTGLTADLTAGCIV